MHVFTCNSTVVPMNLRSCNGVRWSQLLRLDNIVLSSGLCYTGTILHYMPRLNGYYKDSIWGQGEKRRRYFKILHIFTTGCVKLHVKPH